jgi:hypothetical protein
MLKLPVIFFEEAPHQCKSGGPLDGLLYISS